MGPPGSFQFCSRGVFGLQSWEPPRNPKCLANSAQSSSSGASSGSSTPTRNSSQSSIPKKVNQAKLGQKYLAKYNYKANSSSPLGARELSIKQGDKYVLKQEHPSNVHWWLVETEQGDASGYVPSSYLYEIEEKLTGLPWLQNEEVEQPESTAAVGTYKPYVSAYASKDNGVKKASDSEEKVYNCDICAKSFNGPAPYQSHMKSKAHRDELEAAGLL